MRASAARIACLPLFRGRAKLASSRSHGLMKLLVKQLAIRLMRPLAIPIGCQRTTTKWLVITKQKTLGKSLVIAIRLGCPKTTTKSLVIRGNASGDAPRPVPQSGTATPPTPPLRTIQTSPCRINSAFRERRRPRRQQMVRPTRMPAGTSALPVEPNDGLIDNFRLTYQNHE